jgi:autoinducer 2-degrading protein
VAEMTIIVEFETLEGAEPEFIRIISDHAQRTLHEEPGCLRFDVIKPLGEDGEVLPNKVIVNELYADAAAVTAHRANPRMGPLGAATKPLLKSRRMILAKSLAERHVDQGLLPSELNAANDD